MRSRKHDPRLANDLACDWGGILNSWSHRKGTEMKESPNIQTHVVFVNTKKGDVWVIGTDTRRGFTKLAAEKAGRKVRAVMPDAWEVHTAELESLADVLSLASRHRAS
jgi:hypothetical protein